MRLFTLHFFRTLLLCFLLHGVCFVQLCAIQTYPPSSYQLKGNMLTKWVGAESEIDFTKDDILSQISQIGTRAFDGNRTLKRIVLPPSLVEIWVYAFQNCTSLEEVRFAEQEDSYYGEEQYLYLLDYCFEQCPNLRRVHLPKYLKKMETGIFKDCPNLTSITVSNKHPYWRMQDDALITKGLPRTLVLFPPGIEGNYTVHSQITNIGKGAFYSTKLTSVFLPKAVETIEEEAFCEATLLKTINFPIGLRTIKNSAFYRCSSLTTFIFPNSLETIEGLAFSRCKGLPTTVKLPGQIVSLEASAFSANPQVQAYSIDANNPNYIVEDGVLFNGDRSILISIPSGRKSYQLPEGITEIGGGAFRRSSIEKIHFSPDLKRIGDGAFSGCDSLKVILLPKGIKTLGRHAFYECNGITKIQLPSTLEQIGDYAFWRYMKDSSLLPQREIVCHIPSPLDCSIWDNYEGNLEKDILYVPEESIELYKIAPGWMHFGNILPLKKEHQEEPEPVPYELSADGTTLLHWFRSDKEIDFVGDEKLAGVRIIGAGAFAYNQNVERITFPPTIESIAMGAFEQCIRLVTVEAPALQHVAERAFSGCTALESVDMPILTLLGHKAFANCSALKTVSLPSINIIGDETFEMCSSLYRVQLSDCIVQIGNRAFWGCTSLKELDIPCSVPPVLGEDVFLEVSTSEVRLIIPPKAENAYRGEDQWKDFFSNDSSNNLTMEEIVPVVRYCDDYLYFITPYCQKVELYTLQGCLVFCQDRIPSGRVYIGQYPKGLYLLRIDGELFKILI